MLGRGAERPCHSVRSGGVCWHTLLGSRGQICHGQCSLSIPRRERFMAVWLRITGSLWNCGRAKDRVDSGQTRDRGKKVSRGRKQMSVRGCCNIPNSANIIFNKVCISISLSISCLRGDSCGVGCRLGEWPQPAHWCVFTHYTGTLIHHRWLWLSVCVVDWRGGEREGDERWTVLQDKTLFFPPPLLAAFLW